MDAGFWHQRWEEGRIGFHESAENPSLVAHIEALALAQGSRIFLPLCGKTLDIAWLHAKGFKVVGAELSEIAIQQLFEELNIVPQVSTVGKLQLFSADGIDIFVGDVFDLTDAQLGPVDATYDRAALVALPEQLRQRYAAHMTQITNGAPQLLITFVYDQSLMPGPPFSVPDEEVQKLYAGQYDLKLLESKDTGPNRRADGTAKENIWLFSKS